MQLKLTVVAILAALVLGLWLGKSQFPRTETKVVEKEVVKRDVVTVTKEVVRPDGTKETVTTSTDKSQSVADKSSSIKTEASQWHVSAAIKRESLVSQDIYALTIERRVLGPVHVGVTVDTKQTIGLVVGMEF
jgi:hypothetical protein